MHAWGIITVIALVLGNALPSPKTQAAPAPVESIACFPGGMVVGLAHRTLMQWRDTHWTPVSGFDVGWLSGEIPGRVFVGDATWIAELGPDLAFATKWVLPNNDGFLLSSDLQLVDGQLLAVTRRQVFPLQNGGSVAPPTPIPRPLSEFRPARAPVLLGRNGDALACFRLSIMKQSDMRSHCVGGRPPVYHYPVDFHPEGAAAPFLCGDVVVSVKSGMTQARRWSDGHVVHRHSGVAGWGSQCLVGNEMLWVGKHSVAFLDLPKFRKRKEVRLGDEPVSVAVCGESLQVLLRKTGAIVTVPFPP